MRLFSILAVALIGCASASGELRPITLDDVRDGPDIAIRQTDPNSFLATKADFDGDGAEDEARLFADDDAGQFVLQVTWGGAAREPQILHRGPLERVTRALVMGYPAGPLRGHICQPERDGCPADQRRDTTLIAPSIVLTQFEVSQIVYAWTGDGFADYWMAD